MTDLPLQHRIMRASSVNGGICSELLKIVIRSPSTLVIDLHAQFICVSDGLWSE